MYYKKLEDLKRVENNDSVKSIKQFIKAYNTFKNVKNVSIVKSYNVVDENDFLNIMSYANETESIKKYSETNDYNKQLNDKFYKNTYESTNYETSDNELKNSDNSMKDDDEN